MTPSTRCASTLFMAEACGLLLLLLRQLDQRALQCRFHVLVQAQWRCRVELLLSSRRCFDRRSLQRSSTAARVFQMLVLLVSRASI